VAKPNPFSESAVCDQSAKLPVIDFTETTFRTIFRTKLARVIIELMSEKKGVELVRAEHSSEISVTIGDTKLRPQGHPVRIRFEKQTAYVYLVIDTSGSMAGDKLEQAKKGVIDFAKDAFRKEYAVGLISFSTTARHVCEPTYDLRVLQGRIRQMGASGSTNMAEAIRMAHDHLRRLDNTRVMIIATDGLPDSGQDALREGLRAKQDKIDIVTIGTDDADQAFLQRLATRAELGKKVKREVFSEAISSASNLLPAPKSMTKQ
jgi:Mg-chelatase subunit ChlD